MKKQRVPYKKSQLKLFRMSSTSSAYADEVEGREGGKCVVYDLDSEGTFFCNE
jgi:hypothetical protein